MVLGPTPVKRLLTEQLAVSWLELRAFLDSSVCPLLGISAFSRGVLGLEGVLSWPQTFVKTKRGRLRCLFSLGSSSYPWSV